MKLFRRIQYWLRHRRHEADLREEMEHHRDMLRREMQANGMDASDARDAQSRAMGNALLMQEDSRAVWIWPWLESVMQDIRYALRSLRRQPGFTAAAVLTLGIAISLNTSLFTVFNAVALKPLAVPDPGRVVNIYRVRTNGEPRNLGISEQRYLAQHTKLMAGVVAYRDQPIEIDGQKAVAFFVSGDTFSVLQLGMARGRGFIPDEDKFGASENVAVLTYATWQARYGGDEAIVGKTIRVNDIPVIVVGVASEDFTGLRPQRLDLYMPMAALPTFAGDRKWAEDVLRQPDHCCSSVVGRIAPGVTKDQATAELAALFNQFEDMHKFEKGRGVLFGGTSLVDIASGKGRKFVPILALIFAGVTLVLLLACANVGNLLLARASARRHEISVRLSIGASRMRIVRQLLTESMILALLALAIGVAVASFLPGLIMNRVIDELSLSMTADWNVLLYAFAIAAISCIAFGLAPALHSTAKSSTGPARDEINLPGIRMSLRSSLLAAQVAISIVLLTGAGLLVRGIQKARTQDLGYATAGISYATIDLPAGAYSEERLADFNARLNTALNAMSGVISAGVTWRPPLSNARSMTGVRLPGQDENQNRVVIVHRVTSQYFDILHLPLVAGRMLTSADTGREVILVNETFARHYWPGENAVGKYILAGKPREVAGIVRDAYLTGLDQIEPAMFEPFSPRIEPQLVLRTPNAAGEQALRALVTRLDPKARLTILPLTANVDRWLQASQTGATIAAILGMFALALASVGLAGVFAYVVQQRTREIGLRMALGANARDAVRFVLTSHVKALTIGVIVGIGGSVAASAVLTSYLFGVNRFDPVTYAGVIAILLLSAAIAAWMPARRASRVDPAIALRHD